MPRHLNIIVAAALLVGCTEETDPPRSDDAGVRVDMNDAGGGDASSDDLDAAKDMDEPTPFEVQLDWEPCQLSPIVAGECAVVEVPLNWDAPDGRLIELNVRRVPAREQATSQIWFIPGGPGLSNQGNSSAPGLFTENLPNTEVLLMDHRGTGKSTPVSCPDQQNSSSEGGYAVTEAEWDGCLSTVKAEWGDDLAYITATQAARDYGALVEAARRDGAGVYLYGLSYGTYLVQRYLQLFGDGPLAGAILDSVVPMDRGLGSFDEQYDTSVQQLMARCADDPVCGQKLGPDPWARTQAFIAAIDAGACPEAEGAGVAMRRSIGLLNNLDAAYRILTPVLVYRLERCDPADLAAMARLRQALQGAQQPIMFSPIVNVHIMLSEIWEGGPTDLDEAIEAELGLTATSGSTAFIAGLADRWPTYSDELAGIWPEVSTPVLLLNPEIDGRTPLAFAEAAAAHYDGPNQTLIPFPHAGHFVYGSADTTDGSNCARTIVDQFVLDPTASIDSSCVADTIDHALASPAPGLEQVMGTTDLWENP